jgi:hypothetical protein
VATEKEFLRATEGKRIRDMSQTVSKIYKVIAVPTLLSGLEFGTL